MVRLQTISIVRDEEDVIEAFVRHHAPLVERFRITLHRSTDGTRRILERLKEEGIAIELDESDAEGYPQSEVLTTLLRRAETDRPDFIMVLDADEFLGGKDVRSSVEHAPRDAVTLLPWRTYVPGASRVPDRRRVTEDPQYFKLFIPGALAPQIACIETGAHSFVSRRSIRIIVSSGLHLNHFPVRSESQLRAKVIHGWESHLRSPNRKPGENYHWQRLYERCKDASPIGGEELTRIASSYASLTERPAELVYDPIRTPL